MFLNNDWDLLLKEEFNKDYFLDLIHILKKERELKKIVPDENKVMQCLKTTSFKNTKVVILGQDPYPGENQGNGLAFSVENNITIPKSLKNIFKELENDLGFSNPQNGNLIKWAKQGVLLLNTVLTTELGVRDAHKNIGWETFTDTIISLLNNKNEPIVFILWGGNAHKKQYLITNQKHLIIKSSHPSPLSAYRGFLGSKPFSNANAYLEKNELKPIDWSL